MQSRGPISFLLDLYGTCAIVSIAIAFAILDPDFDGDEGAIKDMLAVTKDNFQGRRAAADPFPWLLPIVLAGAYLAMLVILARSLIRVCLQSDHEKR